MEYSKEFKELVDLASDKENGFYIGTGNPNAKILIVGKEAAIAENDEKNNHTYLTNAESWDIHQKQKTCEILRYIPDNPALKKQGHTWRKYQKLHDYIFIQPLEKLEINFLENAFVTEMSDAPCKWTGKAKQRIDFEKRLQYRKDEFFGKSEFIKQFPVVILACWEYIRNYGEGKTREIDNIFGVKFYKEYLTVTTQKSQHFYVHYSCDKNKPKLVIHTHQLSGSTASNELLEKMGEVIREFLLENSLYERNCFFSKENG